MSRPLCILQVVDMNYSGVETWLMLDAGCRVSIVDDLSDDHDPALKQENLADLHAIDAQKYAICASLSSCVWCSNHNPHGREVIYDE